jgi:hypothetical protein
MVQWKGIGALLVTTNVVLDAPALRIPESNAPVSATILWGAESLFLNATVWLTPTLGVAGLNAWEPDCPTMAIVTDGDADIPLPSPLVVGDGLLSDPPHAAFNAIAIESATRDVWATFMCILRTTVRRLSRQQTYQPGSCGYNRNHVASEGGTFAARKRALRFLKADGQATQATDAREVATDRRREERPPAQHLQIRAARSPWPGPRL